MKGSRGKNNKMKMLRSKMARVVKITEVYDPPIYLVQWLNLKVRIIIGIIIMFPIVFMVSLEKPAFTSS